MRIRRLEPGEAAQLRELRLRALRDDPGAFAESYESALTLPPERWEEWAAQDRSVIVVAIDGERWVGMVVCRLLDELPHGAWLSALWVDPAARGTGLGTCLIDGVADWAREQGRVTLDLSVTTNNTAAAALYARAGFTETGRRRPLPADPSRTEVFLARPL